MISINKIREKSGLLLIIVGIAMLAFILGDLFSSRPGSTAVTIGEIDGDAIEAADFENLVAEQEEALKSINQKVDEQVRDQIRTQVWNDIVRERVLGVELSNLGIDVAADEYDDIRFGNNILPDFKNDQTFVNKETGKFEPSSVKQYFAFIQEQYPLLWKTQRNRIIETRKLAKYNNMIKKGLYVNKLQADFENVANNRKIALNYVVAKFSSIPDSTIKASEEEVKAYFNEHKSEEKYKQVDSRTIDYVVFDIKPSVDDIKNAETSINGLVEQFKTAVNDSTFVVNNSAQRFYQPEIYTKGSTEPLIDSMISKASVGTVVGPYKNGTNLRLAKVVSNGTVPEVNARHILLKPTAELGNDKLKVKADSILAAIKKNKNFADVARAISADGSAQNGGDLNWFGKGAMVKAFDEACFSGSKGDMKVVETEFGVHIIEIMDRRETPQIKLAVIDRSIAPSKKTSNEVYDQASNFSINNNTLDLFNKGVEAGKLNKLTSPSLTPQNKYIPGIENPDQIIRWANEAKKGDVSAPFELTDKYVVAVLTQVTEEGEPEFDVVKNQMEVEVIKAKKAEILKEKLKGNNLANIATAIGETVGVEQALTFNSAVLQGGGREPRVIGIATTLKSGELSTPIIGENGVYKLQVVSITEATPSKDIKADKINIASRLTSRVDYGAFNSLVEKAKVKDERYKFY